jgi:hypothetical protein
VERNRKQLDELRRLAEKAASPVAPIPAAEPPKPPTAEEIAHVKAIFGKVNKTIDSAVRAAVQPPLVTVHSCEQKLNGGGPCSCVAKIPRHDATIMAFNGTHKWLADGSVVLLKFIVQSVAPVEVTEVGPGWVSGKMTVVRAGKPRNGRRYWLCACECGVLKEVREDHLRNRTTLSCGCHRNEKLWLGTKARAALARLGQSAGESNSVSAESTGVNTANFEGQIARRVLEGPILGFSPEYCPHFEAVSPPIEGRVFGISLDCFRCHSIFTLKELIAEWERTLQIKLDTPSRRMEVAGRGRTGDKAISGGFGALEIQDVAELNDDFMEVPEDESDKMSDSPSKPRKPARKTSPPGHGPDTDAGADESM